MQTFLFFFIILHLYYLNEKKNIYKVWLFLLVITPFVLWLLPADFFDEGKEICPSKVLLDIECFGCGITRAVMHFHHFEFDEALYYNLGVVWVYPFLIFLWLIWVKDALKKLNLWQKLTQIIKQRTEITS